MRSLLILFFVIATGSVAAENRVATELVSDASAIARGAAFRVGVLFTIPPGAHIYWHNPGDSGLATEIEWRLPEDFRVNDLEWPNPTAFKDDVLDETTFGYEREVLLFATIRAPYAINPGESVAVGARVAWLVCLEDGQCIPEDAVHEMSIPVAEEATASADAALFEAHAARTPGTIRESGLPAKITVAGQPSPSVTIRLSEPWRVHLDGPPPRFFPDRGGAWLMTDDTVGEQDSPEIAFNPTGEVDGYTSGALTLPVVNTDTGVTRTVYLRFGARPRD